MSASITQGRDDHHHWRRGEKTSTPVIKIIGCQQLFDENGSQNVDLEGRSASNADLEPVRAPF